MKTKKLLLFFGIILAICILPNLANAAFSTVTLEDLSVTSPKSGTYTTGQVITITATFSDTVVGEENDVPTLKLKFGTSETYGDVFISKGTIKDNKVIYSYTISETDSGSLSLRDFYLSALKDASGDIINVTSPNALSGSKITANPLVWTDTSKATFTIDSNYYLNISNITELQHHYYYVFITNSSTEPKLELDDSSIITNHNGLFNNKWDVKKFLEKKDDLYYWLCEEQFNYETGKREHKFIVSGKKLERPAQKAIGSRINCFFNYDGTGIYLYEPYDYQNTRNIKLKIGTITDNSILLALKNNESNALSRLLAYAKSANSIYTGTVVLGRSNSITANMNINNKAYYYVYAVLDDENGKYYPVEDVSLYQALVSDAVGKNLFNYLDEQFTWNLDTKSYFSDFSDSSAVLENMYVSIDSSNSENVTNISIAVQNVKINSEKKHQFYYYISNSRDDIPSYDSNLWKKVDKAVVDEKAGTCYISTGDITTLSYISKINLSEDTYISIYEVVDDKEITSETISGTYKLGLNASKIILLSETPSTPTVDVDDTIANTQIPQTGESILIISLIILFIVSISICVLKIRKYNF